MAYAEQSARTGLWRARYVDPVTGAKSTVPNEEGRGSAFQYRTRKTAERAAQRYEDELREQAQQRGRGRSAHGDGAMLWRDWRPKWEELRQVAHSTALTEKPSIDKHLAPRWGNVALQDITREEVLSWARKTLINNGAAPATVRRIVAILSGSLTVAVDHNVLPYNPLTGINKKLPAPAPLPEIYLEPHLIARFIAELEDPYRLAVEILVGTGMRFGEMAGLHWARVNLSAGSIHVVETWSRKTQSMTALPKGRRAHYTIIPEWLAPRLANRTLARSCGRPHDQGSAPCTTGLVVPGPLGAPLDTQNMLGRQLRPAMERAGIPPIRQHDLRHLFASWLAEGGQTVDQIADLLGHADTRVTQRYRHLSPDHMNGARDVLNQVNLRPNSAPTRKMKIVPNDL